MFKLYIQTGIMSYVFILNGEIVMNKLKATQKTIFIAMAVIATSIPVIISGMNPYPIAYTDTEKQKEFLRKHLSDQKFIQKVQQSIKRQDVTVNTNIDTLIGTYSEGIEYNYCFGTALHIAAFQGNEDAQSIARWLIEHNANPLATIKNVDITPLQLALESNEEMEKILQKAARKCNTPSCDKMPWQLSKLKFDRCFRCKQVRYCSKECQKADWKGGHKKACKLSVQTTATTDTAPEPTIAEEATTTTTDADPRID